MLSARWNRAGIRPGSLSINLAPSQLKDNQLLALVDYFVDEKLIEYQQLRFEVSLTLALEQPEIVREFFEQAASLGIKCALDGFGVQEAGFELLNRLKVDMVKLDRSLIRTGRGSQTARAVIAAVATLGNAKGFSVMGLGVEQQRQLDNLNLTGCHLVQGYYYAPSLNAEDFTRFYQEFYRQAAS